MILNLENSMNSKLKKRREFKTMKITKSKLAQIIKEELTKAQQDRKEELQDELEDLEHQ